MSAPRLKNVKQLTQDLVDQVVQAAELGQVDIINQAIKHHRNVVGVSQSGRRRGGRGKL